MAQELGKSFPVSPYREVLAGASAVSFVSILITFYAWFPKDESYLLGVLALLPVFLPYAFIPLRLYGRRLRSGRHSGHDDGLRAGCSRNLLGTVCHHLG